MIDEKKSLEHDTKLRLPSHIAQVLTILEHEVHKLLRSKRVIGIMAIAVLASYALTSSVLSNSDESSGDGLFGYAVILSPILIIVSAALVGSDSLLVEFHERTGFSLFPNPVSRTAIWFGKFLAAELILLIVLIIYFGLFVAVAETMGHHITPALFLTAIPFSLLVATMMLSFAFLVSSVFKGPIGATITVLFSLFVSPVADGIIASQNVAPWFTPFSATNNAILNLFFKFEEGDGNRFFFPFGFQDYMPLGANLAVLTAYAIASGTTSIVLFRRRDM